MALVRDDLAMTVDAFVAFTQARSDDGRWELIDGEAILNPSPTYGHQRVVRNLLSLLIAAEDAGAPWEVLPGLGVKLSDRSMPVPDVLIRPRTRIGGHYCDDMIVAFEVLSPSSRGRDLLWKRQAYGTLPSLRHYVVLDQRTVELGFYSRENGWAEAKLAGPDAVLRLHGLEVDLAARALYAGTGLV